MTAAAPPPGGYEFLIKRHKQVSWFDTRNLLATGSMALAATIVGSMSGRREIMAALEPRIGDPFDYADEKDLWIDYVADTGDGWNATTSVAWLVGRDGIVLDPGGKPTPQPIPPDCRTEGMPAHAAPQLLLPGGRILILGGDEVYPTASAEAYKERFIEPFRCARWHQKPPRHVYSIPGNHDWYDGLTSFIRLFCQSGHGRRWFGAWQAQQRRSYYSIRLPHRWWIWGLDMALEDDLDPPQYEYFRAQAQHLQPGDKLILSVPTPTWIKRAGIQAKSGTGRFVGGDKLDLIMKLPQEEGRDVDIPLVLTGDLHYYARHRAELANGTRDYIVCGGGGAFGKGTLQVPDIVEVSDNDWSTHDAELQETFGGKPALYPDREDSVKLRRGVLRFPVQNPAFTGALTALQAITLWLLAAAAPGWLDQLIVPGLGFAELCAIIARAGASLLSSPGLAIWVLILVAGFTVYAARGHPPCPRWQAVLAGIVHALLQIVGTFLVVWLAAQAIGYLAHAGTGPAGKAEIPIWAKYATFALAGLISHFYCGFLFGLYLLLAHKGLGLHDLEVFSAQAIEGYKGFLRMRVTAEGLTIYPIGLRHHAADWRAAEGASLEDVEKGVYGKVQRINIPLGAQRGVDPCAPLEPHLLERPIFIPGAKAP
ncbi:MAG TPA: hypothetical protein VGO55_18460 [Allosphingosinicella sp.]|jgi:hypothetical protein|nr:hypothetical protein [Allosphingosinicella sp.]